MIGVIKIVLTVLFIIISLAITVIVLMQEGKQAGLSSSVSGGSDTYWGKNKGRSAEGALEKVTTILGILFIVIALILNLGIFA